MQGVALVHGVFGYQGLPAGATVQGEDWGGGGGLRPLGQLLVQASIAGRVCTQLNRRRARQGLHLRAGDTVHDDGFSGWGQHPTAR
jgi:hypothetical protein